MAGAEYPKMRASFFSNAERLLVEAAEAAAKGDLARVSAIGHNLRGSTGTFGAAGVSLMCAELEERGKAGRREGLQEFVAEIAAEYARARAVLEAS